MKYLILILSLIAMPAFAESPTYSLLISGPAWHATSDHYNWKTFGIGAAAIWQDDPGQLAIGIGEYKNSMFQTSDYIGIQQLIQIRNTHWEVGAAIGLVNGYPRSAWATSCAPINTKGATYEPGVCAYGQGVVSSKVELPDSSLNFFAMANIAYELTDTTKLVFNIMPASAFSPAVIQANFQIQF